MPPGPGPLHLTLPLADTAATEALGVAIAPLVGRGDVLLLAGPIGAGKTHFARALIQSRLAAAGQAEEVPSPTFTLVQTYDAGGLAIIHADLYRLPDRADLAELGLEEASETALVLVEWPERMRAPPPDALTIGFGMDDAGRSRRADLSARHPRWERVLAALAAGWAR